MSNPPSAFSYSRLAGAALGLMCGDALGMPVEGWSAPAIAQRHGRLDAMLPGRLPAGSYTDDSQMMIAILETVAHCGALDPAQLASRFVAGFEGWRGYGGRIFGVMDRLRQGAAWDRAGTDSFGNGGAMRVGVLGAIYPYDEERLVESALNQGRITHFHPQGLAGAACLALAAGLACRLGAAGEKPAASEFVAYLLKRIRHIDHHFARRLAAMPLFPLDNEQTARQSLRAAYACDVTAAESVPAAVGAFLAAESLKQAVVLAVSLGGDTDTIGAMAGALAGAYWGVEALPPEWIAALENKDRGRDHVLRLCQEIVAKLSSKNPKI